MESSTIPMLPFISHVIPTLATVAAARENPYRLIMINLLLPIRENAHNIDSNSLRLCIPILILMSQMLHP
jgi:hypothetical protein